MTTRRLAVLLCACFRAAFLAAQEDLLDADADALFGDGSAEGGGSAYIETRNAPAPLFSRPGFVLDASYLIALGIFPGFQEMPWNFNTPWKFDPEHDSFDTIVGASMSATLGLLIQPSDVLRVRQTVTFAIPVQKDGEIPISFKEFYLDYNLLGRAYIRAGKFDFKWGWSPNYPYVDLPARIPLGKTAGAAYTLRAQVPVGVGGFEVIAMARSGLIEDVKKPRIEEFGFGGKFNLAVPVIDVDIGAFAHRDMPFRAFISMKKTLPRGLEAYAEGMASLDHDIEWDSWDNFIFSCNAGVMRDFFTGRLKVNAEAFFNADSSDYAVAKNRIKEDEDDEIPLFSGLNAALNLSFNPRIFFNSTFFVSGLYSAGTRSAQIIPGFRMEPMRHLKVYVTMQVILGPQGEGYYNTNADTNDRSFVFSVVAILNGGYNFDHFEK